MGNAVFSPLKLILIIAAVMFLFLGIGFMLLMPSGHKSPGKNNNCKIGGCNNEMCQGASEEEKVSICLYNPVFECYKNARCEIQNDGKCGWTQTEELKACLEENKDQPL